MGITGELVRSVFSRNRSVGTQDSSNGRSNVVEKRKWSSVRSYLCGDEFNSVLAEEDSASVKSSEATVTQPILEHFTDKGDIQIDQETKETHNSISKLFHEEDAAIIIQSAFRSFLARRHEEENKLKDCKQEPLAVTESRRDSVSTSIEVQTGNSVEVFSVQEESIAVPHWIHQKARTKIFKTKEDWDDSTVSSKVSKMRIRNRLEATTRRERALAYAFSQQLRICSKKKQNRTDGRELNMGWSWLERWMATRLPENSFAENHISKQVEPFDNSQKYMVATRIFDVAGEEKESCGSNEVSVQIDSFSESKSKETERFKPTMNRPKATRSVSRRKSVPGYQFPKECSKVSKKDCSKENAIGKKNKQKQAGNKKEVKS